MELVRLGLVRLSKARLSLDKFAHQNTANSSVTTGRLNAERYIYMISFHLTFSWARICCPEVLRNMRIAFHIFVFQILLNLRHEIFPLILKCFDYQMFRNVSIFHGTYC
jgi:hypothetical protein